MRTSDRRTAGPRTPAPAPGSRIPKPDLFRQLLTLRLRQVEAGNEANDVDRAADERARGRQPDRDARARHVRRHDASGEEGAERPDHPSADVGCEALAGATQGDWIAGRQA